ncbi:hypothetical protein ACFQV8_24840 [Pseudonocardia benzenivorans]
MRAEELTVRVEDGPDARMVVCTGELTVAGASSLHRVLRKHLLDRGRLLVDVAALRPTSAAQTTVFATVLARAGGWPHARMVLVAPDGPVVRVMRLAGHDREVPSPPTARRLWSGSTARRIACGGPPSCRRDRTHRASSASSSGSRAMTGSFPTSSATGPSWSRTS